LLEQEYIPKDVPEELLAWTSSCGLAETYNKDVCQDKRTRRLGEMVTHAEMLRNNVLGDMVLLAMSGPKPMNGYLLPAQISFGSDSQPATSLVVDTVNPTEYLLVGSNEELFHQQTADFTEYLDTLSKGKQSGGCPDLHRVIDYDLATRIKVHSRIHTDICDQILAAIEERGLEGSEDIVQAVTDVKERLHAGLMMQVVDDVLASSRD
jgi:hypothetical protein